MIAVRRKLAKDTRAYEPTPRDIRRACEQIQATWSPKERAKRAGRARAAWWNPPSIHLSALTEAFFESQSDNPSVLGLLTAESER